MGFATLNPSYIEVMHDIRWIRENPEEFDRGLQRRGLPLQSGEILGLDKEWRALQTAAEEAQAARNRLSREVGAAKARGESADELLARIAQSRDTETETAAKATDLRKRLDAVMTTDLGNFNRMLRERNIGNVVPPGQ